MFKLLKLVAQRLGLGVLVLFAVSLIIFLGVEMLPGDLCQEIQGQAATEETVAACRKELGLDKDASIAVTCATANRSSTAIGLMLRDGYQSLYNLTGGMEAWGNARLPMVNASGEACTIG